jgi:hypothetical protein
MGCEDMNSIRLGYDEDQWRALVRLVSMVIKFEFPLKADNFSS